MPEPSTNSTAHSKTPRFPANSTPKLHGLERTWLYRVRDWLPRVLEIERREMRLSDMPGNALTLPKERNRVAAVLEKYNEDLNPHPGRGRRLRPARP